MTIHTTQRDDLLHCLDRGMVDQPIEQRAKIITLFNSVVDDKKCGKPPLIND